MPKMLFSSIKLLLPILPPAAAMRFSSNFFVGKNVRLRSHQQKFPLAGIKVTVLRQPYIPQLISKLFENFGAEITAFCDTSNFRNRKINPNWTNSDFVKAHVYGSFEEERIVENGEQEVDLTVDGDLNLVKNSVRKADIFIDGLKEKRLEEIGLKPEEMLKLNSKLIVARIPPFKQQASEGNEFDEILGKNLSKEFLELLRQNSNTQILLGNVAGFSKILITLFGTHLSASKGQILEMSASDSLHQLDRIASTMPSASKAFNKLYLTKDKKAFSLCLPSSGDQQKCLEILNIEATTKNLEAVLESKIEVLNFAEISSLLKSGNFINDYSNPSKPVFRFQQFKLLSSSNFEDKEIKDNPSK